MISSPCYKCKLRKLGCHSTCVAYLKYKEHINVHGQYSEKEMKEYRAIRKVHTLYRNGKI